MKLKKVVVALFIMGFFAINFTFLTASGKSSFDSKNLEIDYVDPNTHYGYVRDFNNNCCKRRYQDDSCKGVFC